MIVIDRSEAIFAAFSRLRQFARYTVGRVTGTCPPSRGSYRQMLDLAESRHIHRVELNALTGLLIRKGVFTQAEFDQQLEDEALHYEAAVQKQFPEVRPAPDGRSYALDPAGAVKRCREEEWPP